MAKTLVDLDDDLLRRVQAALGAGTKKGAINDSLREVLRAAAICRYVQALRPDEFVEGASGLVLADASALVHCGHSGVATRLLPLLVLGDVATCAAVSYELASVTGEGRSSPLAALRDIELQWLPTNDVDLQRAAAIQAELTASGGPTLPWSRLVIAAVAERYQATLLHYTTDFDLVAKVTGQRTDWIAPEGSLP